MDISNKTSVAVTKESTGKCLHASIDDQLSNPHNAECVHPTNKQRPNANKSLYTKGGAAVEPTVCNWKVPASQVRAPAYAQPFPKPRAVREAYDTGYALYLFCSHSFC